MPSLFSSERLFIYHTYPIFRVIRPPDVWRQITINKTEKQIEKLLSQISDLLKQFY